MFVFDFPKKLGYWGIETSHLALVSFGDSGSGAEVRG